MIRHVQRYAARGQQARPTHFLSVRVDDSAVLAGVKHVQDQIVASDPALKHHRIKLSKMHITLLLFCPRTPEDVQSLSTRMQELQTLLSAQSSFSQANVSASSTPHSSSTSSAPIRLHFNGLDTFSSRVLWMSPSKDPKCPDLAHFESFCSFLRSFFMESHSAVLLSERDWRPHVTLFKNIRRDNRSEQADWRPLQLQPQHYSQWSDCNFGSQTFQHLELSSMVDGEDSRGFYRCVASVPLASPHTQPPPPFVPRRHRRASPSEPSSASVNNSPSLLPIANSSPTSPFRAPSPSATSVPMPTFHLPSPSLTTHSVNPSTSLSSSSTSSISPSQSPLFVPRSVTVPRNPANPPPSSVTDE
eukprot:GILI01005212.1.p1 GENE.GILI01005212.1~~GILI01005212.1.p1  ORF type:complete len:359 (-),score=49.56 GILI01005212.1:279-1355(-)